MRSRVTTTRVLAEAIAASDSKPAFLAGNAIGFYGDHGAEPVDEHTRSRSDSLLGNVTRAWEAATEPAARAGARVVVLRTSPVFDRRSQPLGALRLLFKAGLGGPLGDGSQYMPMISTRDWVDAVVHLADSDDLRAGQPVCRASTDQRGVHAGAGAPAAPAGLRPGTGVRHPPRCRSGSRRAARVGELRSGRPAEQRLRVPRPRRRRRAARGPQPQPVTQRVTVATRQLPRHALEHDAAYDGSGAGQRHGPVRSHDLAAGDPVEQAYDEPVRRAPQHPEAEDLRHDPAYDEPASRVGTEQPHVRPRGGRTPRVERAAGPARRTRPRLEHAARPTRAAPRGRAGPRPRGRATRPVPAAEAREHRQGHHQQDREQTHSLTLPSIGRHRAVVHRQPATG